MIFPRHEAVTVAETMAGMDMSDMNMTGSSSTTTMATMMVAFHNDIATTLYSMAWTPSNAGAYAGTCIFLILLAVIFRSLITFKSWQEGRWLDAELNRRYVVVNGKQTLAQQVSTDSLAKQMTLTANGVEEDVMVVRKRKMHVSPWRFSVDPIRALLDTTIAGVGYLLMLAVMTVNIGYFLSILGGTFLGSLAVGRFNALGEH